MPSDRRFARLEGRRQPTRSAVVSASFALAVLGILMGRPMPVAAECTFNPPWPDITKAIPSAREIVVGDIVIDFDASQLKTDDGGSREKALRITSVIRGKSRVGDLVDVQFLLPNWPWHKFSDDFPAFPSCSYLRAFPGERIVIAFDALKLGREIKTNDGVAWYQPRTRYNAMGVLVPSDMTDEWGDADWAREQVTLAQLRALAGLPATDLAERPSGQQSNESWPAAIIAGLVAGAFVLWRARASRDIARR